MIKPCSQGYKLWPHSKYAVRSARYRELVTLSVFELVGHQTGSKSCLPCFF